jgi:hypothetical protein
VKWDSIWYESVEKRKANIGYFGERCLRFHT